MLRVRYAGYAAAVHMRSSARCLTRRPCAACSPLGRLIMAQWRQCSDLAPPSPVAPQQPAADSSVQASGLSGRTKRLLRGMGSLVSRSSLQCGEDGGGLRSSGKCWAALPPLLHSEIGAVLMGN